MTAVIGPVGIQHTDLCHSGISVLLTCKIILNMKEILEGHSKSQGIIEFLQGSLLHGSKSVKHNNVCRLCKLLHQSFRFLQTGLTGIHRVNAVVPDSCQLLLRNITLDHIGGSGTDHRLLLLVQQLHTLFSGICSLVKLSGQELYTEGLSAVQIKSLLIDIVHRRLGKHADKRFLISFIRNILHIIADQLTDFCNSGNAEIASDLRLQFLCLYRISFFFLYIDSAYIAHWDPSIFFFMIVLFLSSYYCLLHAHKNTFQNPSVLQYIRYR